MDTTCQQLEQLLATGDAGALEHYLGTCDATAATCSAALAMREHVCALPQPPDARTPRLQTLHAVAMLRSEHAREEYSQLLYEATVQLVAEGDIAWAATAAICWQESYQFLPLSLEDAIQRGTMLLDTNPELAEERPLLPASLALKATTVGDRVVAERMWEQSLHHPQLGSSSDEYWTVQVLWASSELAVTRGDLPQAQALLRRARNHFVGRMAVGENVERVHQASMNLAYCLIMAGSSRRAAEELEADLRHFEPGSIFACFLEMLRALALADIGELDQAAALTPAWDGVPENNPAALLGAIGPTRIMIAASRGDGATVDATVSDLLRAEIDSMQPVEYRVVWRLLAARAERSLGRWLAGRRLASDALALSDGLPMPHLRAWALMLLSTLCEAGADQRQIAEAVQLGSRHGLYDLFTRREPEAGTVCLLLMLAGGAPMDDFTKRCLLLRGESLVRLAMTHAVRLGADEAALEAVFRSELGWNAAPGVAAASRKGVEICVLGGFRVLVDGEDVSDGPRWQGRRKAKLLLARLIAAHGETLHRDQVAEDLWGEIDPRRISRNLGPLVHTIRRVLEPGLSSGESGTYLRTRTGCYSLALGVEDWCDLHEFTTAARRCLDHRDDAARSAGERALASYTGEFLAGFGYDNWVVNMRTRLWSTWKAVVLRVAELHAERGTLPEARRALELLADQEPACEEACRLLMQLCADAGDLAGASAAYHRTMQALGTDLGLSPSAETRAAYASLIGD